MLADAPGELAKLTAILKDEHVNIEAMSIQDANEYFWLCTMLGARLGDELLRGITTKQY